MNNTNYLPVIQKYIQKIQTSLYSNSKEIRLTKDEGIELMSSLTFLMADLAIKQDLALQKIENTKTITDEIVVKGGKFK